MTLDSLLDSLPRGEPAYVRLGSGMWGVAIFAPGTTERLATVATGMTKPVAAWMAEAIREAWKE